MNTDNYSFPKFALLLCMVLCLFQACVPHEKLLNFQDESSTDVLNAQYVQEIQKIKIQSDDILSITVSTGFDTSAAKIFNMRPPTPSMSGSFIGQGYLVDEDGLIEFPVLGKVQVRGLTREVAKDTIKQRLLEYLRDPVVEVRFLNLHVSVMGEVTLPGIYTFPDEHFTILEALTQAGDLTLFADRENIMVIREVDKVREFGKVDVTSARAFESPYFYLTQNDVIYVKPLKEKAKTISDPLTKVLSVTGVLISVATLIATLAR